MTKLIYDADIEASALDGQTVAVIGYGSQGEAHARNLAESGVTVVVGLRPDSTSAERAREAGLIDCGEGRVARLPAEKHAAQLTARLVVGAGLELLPRADLDGRLGRV